MRHFQAHQSGPITLRVFESIHDPDFEHYLNGSGMYFMLCHDGANLANVGEELTPPYEDTVSRHCVEAEEFARKVIFRGMILSMIKRGYNVALINGLEWMDTKVGLSRFFSAGLSLTYVFR